jgi:hypothetical protein
MTSLILVVAIVAGADQAPAVRGGAVGRRGRRL